MNYFKTLVAWKTNYLYLRKHREKIKGLKKSLIFSVGDIVKVAFFRKSYSYLFEGICISIKKKSFLSPNLSFSLRNVVLGISIEMMFSYYINRLYHLKLQDYKRKSMHIRSSKLFSLRKKKNSFTRVTLT